MDTKREQFYFLSTLIFLSAVLAFFIFKPFLIALSLAAVFAVVLQPVYRAMLRLATYPGLAALATIIVAAICLALPLSFIGTRIVGEAHALYTSLSDGSGQTYLATVFESVDSYGFSSTKLSSGVDTYIKNGLNWLVAHLGAAVGGVSRFVVSFILFLIALYYLLRDGVRLRTRLIELSPLRDADDRLIFGRLEQAVNSVVRGSLVIALVQGVLTSAGFAIFGVPNSILWGVVAAFAALIPGIGTSLVILPGVLYLMAVGLGPAALGLLVWGVIAVGLIDNLLGPKLVGKGMSLHPLIVLLSVFGGLALFGAAGVFLGPLTVSLLFALLSLYPQLSTR
jgi:predicted PurR-regulated permease PerM